MWCEGYLPVPTISRELKDRPAMVSGVEVNLLLILAARGSTRGFRPAAATPSNEIDDFDFVAILDGGVVERRALQNDQIQLDGDASRIDLQAGEELGNRQRPREFVPVAIERDQHCRPLYCRQPRVPMTPNGEDYAEALSTDDADYADSDFTRRA